MPPRRASPYARFDRRALESAEAEARERLARVCGDTLELLRAHGALEDVVEALRAILDEGDEGSFLERAKRLGFQVATVPHRRLIELLAEAWRASAEASEMARVREARLLDAMETSGKQVPLGALALHQALRTSLEVRAAKGALTHLKLRAMLDLLDGK